MIKFKVGDKVRVVGSPDGDHNKWDDSAGFDKNTWVSAMDTFIGTETVVQNITSSGIVLSLTPGYYFPPQALELISEPTEQPQPKEQTYTEEQIRKVFTYMEWHQDTFDELMTELKKSTDPEYAVYLKLKERFENAQ